MNNRFARKLRDRAIDISLTNYGSLDQLGANLWMNFVSIGGEVAALQVLLELGNTQFADF